MGVRTTKGGSLVSNILKISLVYRVSYFMYLVLYKPYCHHYYIYIYILLHTENIYIYIYIYVYCPEASELLPRLLHPLLRAHRLSIAWAVAAAQAAAYLVCTFTMYAVGKSHGHQIHAYVNIMLEYT